jgi:hypothetical protein
MLLSSTRLVRGSFTKVPCGKQSFLTTPIRLPEAAELLLDWEANTNIRNLSGDTPLHLASRKNHVRIINLLLQRGADKTLENKKKVTAATETRSAEAKQLITSAITRLYFFARSPSCRVLFADTPTSPHLADELDPDMLADIGDVDA